MQIRKDVQQVAKLDSIILPTVKAIATAILNSGQDVYYCTIAGVKVAIIK